MAGKKRDFTRELLIKISYEAGYYGGWDYEIAQRLEISIRTWNRWKRMPEVQKAIQDGNKRRENMTLKQIGINANALLK